MITSLPQSVVFDLYGTLLHSEPILRSEDEWLDLVGMTRAKFQAQTTAEILRQHADARENGITHPEIQWSEIVTRVAPRVNPAFVARFERRSRANDGAMELVEWLRAHSIPLALASNAQAYTLDELEECGFELDWFPVHFLSYQRGFSKPDIGVFRWIADRLAPIPPHQILMVGDREENDIVPAQAAGFATCVVTSAGLMPLLNTLKSLAK